MWIEGVFFWMIFLSFLETKRIATDGSQYIFRAGWRYKQDIIAGFV
jgi:hypothetical protein